MRIHGDFREQQAVDWVEVLLWEFMPCRWLQIHQDRGLFRVRVWVGGDWTLGLKMKQRRTYIAPSPVLKATEGRIKRGTEVSTGVTRAEKVGGSMFQGFGERVVGGKTHEEGEGVES